jgi:hypothetical protein
LCVACLNSSQISSFSSASMMPFTREFSVQFSSWHWKLKWCLILHFYSTVNENWLVASFGSSRCKAENWNVASFCISTVLSTEIDLLPHFAFLQHCQWKWNVAWIRISAVLLMNIRMLYIILHLCRIVLSCFNS